MDNDTYTETRHNIRALEWSLGALLLVGYATSSLEWAIFYSFLVWCIMRFAID